MSGVFFTTPIENSQSEVENLSRVVAPPLSHLLGFVSAQTGRKLSPFYVTLKAV
jgi:hypothetical protein